MIIFLTTGDHSYTHREVIKQRDVDVGMLSYERVLGRSVFRKATYIFTDLDRLSLPHLDRAAQLYRSLRGQGLQVLNDPAKWRGRYGLLRALHAANINDFTAYLPNEIDHIRRWPVFLRGDGNHDEPLSDLLHDRAAVEDAIARAIDDGASLLSLLIIEYCAEEVLPGVFRKLSVFRIGPNMVAFTCVHEGRWIVKYGQLGVATPELYAEEERMVAENPFGKAMAEVFKIAGVDYGRVDFGLVDGKPQIYEINTNPDVRLMSPPSTPVRARSKATFMANYLAALNALDRTAPRPAIQAPSHRQVFLYESPFDFARIYLCKILTKIGFFPCRGTHDDSLIHH